MWHSLNEQDFGLMSVFSESIDRSQRADSGLLPDLRNSNNLIVLSDYSGHHNSCKFESYGILLVGMEESWPSWESTRLELRRRFKLGHRSFAFKKLNDACKRRALEPFLHASDGLTGVCATVLIDKSVGSMFAKAGLLDFSEPQLQPYSHFGSTFERLLRVVHLVSFFVAGLSAPGQNVVWFTDQDDIAANHARLTQLTSIWATIMSHYLRHNLGHLRCGTTESDNGTLQIEDLAAIPDLVAGALAEAITCYDNESCIPGGSVIILLPRSVSPKSRSIIEWLARASGSLRRLTYLIHPVRGTTTLTIKRLRFHT